MDYPPMRYGQQARAQLLADGVKLDYTRTSDAPTSVAQVTLDPEGSATYKFLIDGTATFDFDNSWLPDPSVPPAVLYLGTLATVVEPGATNLLHWAKGVKTPIVYDPNVRSSVLEDPDQYLGIVQKWALISSVIKMSEDDIAWLYPDVDFRKAAENFINEKTQLVVVTRGSNGISAYTEDGEVSVQAVTVDVVDTVGAGDTGWCDSG
ncbi:MAG: PfkB family carbohydrate kinase [Actinomycetota bacterium]